MPFRNLIACLMYVMLCTQPDINTAVNILSRYSNKNNKELRQCLERLLRDLNGSIDIKLPYVISANYNNILFGYIDSDWVSYDDKGIEKVQRVTHSCYLNIARYAEIHENKHQ